MKKRSDSRLAFSGECGTLFQGACTVMGRVAGLLPKLLTTMRNWCLLGFGGVDWFGFLGYFLKIIFN